MLKIVKRWPIISLLIFIGVIFGVIISGDPIKRLALELSFEAMSGSPWQAGFSNFVELPSSAEPRDVVFSLGVYGKIIEVEKIVVLEPGPTHQYFGALVENFQRRRTILIFWYRPGKNFNGGEGLWTVKSYSSSN